MIQTSENLPPQIDPTSVSATSVVVYPNEQTMKSLYTITAHDQKTQRLMNRLWTRIKTGR